ncbi:hypothetical protein B0H14DRAFT_2564085 [Mycena olivaceomarginata]|nr:hypothetical protein B0H14DRAFT_2564085 [Mycena olivaceomarginata]
MPILLPQTLVMHQNLDLKPQKTLKPQTSTFDPNLIQCHSNGAATTSTRPSAASTGFNPVFRRQWRRNDFDAPICNIDGLQPRFCPHAAYENDDEDYFDMPPTTAVRAPPRNDAATTPTAPLVPLSQQHAIYEDDDDDEDYFDVPPDPAASAADHMVALEELDLGLLSNPDQPLNVQDVLDAPAPQVSGVDKALLTFELYWDPPVRNRCVFRHRVC